MGAARAVRVALSVRCDIGFEIRLKTLVTPVALNVAVEFIRDSYKVPIISPGRNFEQYAKLTEDLPEDADRLRKILVAWDAITRAQWHEAMARQPAEAAMNETTRHDFVRRG